MNEAERRTRKERIDHRLRNLSLSWKIVKYTEGLSTQNLHCVAI